MEKNCFLVPLLLCPLQQQAIIGKNKFLQTREEA